jgi:hypothetical protein
MANPIIGSGAGTCSITSRAPRKLLSGLDSGGIMAIITQSDLIATVGQRGFWDEQQRVSKLQEKKPVLKRLEVVAFYWTVLAPDIVNPGREEQGSVSV